MTKPCLKSVFFLRRHLTLEELHRWRTVVSVRQYVHHTAICTAHQDRPITELVELFIDEELDDSQILKLLLELSKEIELRLGDLQRYRRLKDVVNHGV